MFTFVEIYPWCGWKVYWNRAPWAQVSRRPLIEASRLLTKRTYLSLRFQISYWRKLEPLGRPTLVLLLSLRNEKILNVPEYNRKPGGKKCSIFYTCISKRTLQQMILCSKTLTKFRWQDKSPRFAEEICRISVLLENLLRMRKIEAENRQVY